MTWTTRPRSEGAGGLHYVADGQGMPLVLIHGVGLRAEAWNALVPHLSDAFQVMALDMPGHGASPLQESATLEDFTDRCASFIRAMSEPVCVAGHSMGALLAVRLAAKMPDHIRGFAALNTVFRRSRDAARAVKARAAALSGKETPDPTATLHRWFGANPTGDTKAASDACHSWLTEGNAEGYAAAYRIFAHTDGPTEAQLARLSCPALFVTGADDPNSTPQMSEALAAACGGTCAVVPSAAHMLPMTHPHTVASRLRAHFLPVPSR